MGWFKRIKEGITTSTDEKKETPEGLWYKCPKCKTITSTKEHLQNLYVCTNCNYHHRINAKEYFKIFFDKNEFSELDAKMTSKDPLGFKDSKKYTDRLKQNQKDTGLKEAITSAFGKMNGENVVFSSCGLVVWSMLKLILGNGMGAELTDSD